MKWFLAPSPTERGGDIAVQILAGVVNGSVELRQPAHFVAEVSAVLARLKPDDALLDVRDLLELDFRRIDDPEIYAIATDLAIELDQHVFDTLYHAVALATANTTLVTSDLRYFNRAHGQGRIVMLDDWREVPGV